MKEEYYRETSTRSNERKGIAVLALVLILALCSKDITALVKNGHINVMGLGMGLGLLALWVWRISFSYTMILYKDRTMEIIQHGLGFNRSYTVDLRATQTFAEKYKRSFFRKTKISKYIHRYDSLDNNDQHLLVFTEGPKQKMVGLLFKSSDKFVRNMKKQFPDNYIDM